MWRIFDMLFPPREDEVVIRDISDDAFAALVAPRIVSVTHPETIALLPFSHAAVRSTIHEAKYHGSEQAFRTLSLALAEYLRDADDTSRNPRLVPLPLGNQRRTERGFNQSEEITRRVAKELDITVATDLLIRTRETVSQISLPREKRKENMRGAFGAAHTPDPACTYLIIDDVVTTGATMQAAIDALREAGAIHIVPLALAH